MTAVLPSLFLLSVVVFSSLILLIMNETFSAVCYHNHFINTYAEWLTFGRIRLSPPKFAVYSVAIFGGPTKNYTRWQNLTNPPLFMHFKQWNEAKWLNWCISYTIMHLFLKKENFSIIVKDIGTVALNIYREFHWLMI